MRVRTSERASFFSYSEGRWKILLISTTEEKRKRQKFFLPCSARHVLQQPSFLKESCLAEEPQRTGSWSSRGKGRVFFFEWLNDSKSLQLSNQLMLCEHRSSLRGRSERIILGRLYKCLESRCFRSISMLVIVANVVWITWLTDRSLSLRILRSLA